MAGEYACGTINCDLSKDEPHTLYLKLCEFVREMNRSNTMYNTLEAKGLVNIDFYPDLSVINEQTRLLRVKMRNDSYYMIGLQQHLKSILWEARESMKDKKGVLKGSKALPFDSSYRDKKFLVGLEVSHDAFVRAVEILGVTANLETKNPKEKENIAKAYFTLVLFIPEGTRFRWILNFVAETFETGMQAFVQQWYTKLINNWDVLSSMVVEYNKAIVGNIKLPIPVEDLTEQDKAIMESHDTDVLFVEKNLRAAAVCLMVSNVRDNTGEQGGQPHIGGRGGGHGGGRGRGRGGRGGPYAA